MSIRFSVNRMEDRDIAIARIEGTLDFEARNEFKAALDNLRSCSSSRLVVDLTKVDSMSTLFIGPLIDLGKFAGEGGRTLSVMACGTVEKVCQQVGLGTVASLIRVEK